MPASQDPRSSGLGPAAPHSLLRNGEEVAREGRAIRKFINGLDGIGAAEVITNGLIVYNLAVGRRILVSELVLSLHTLSDSIHVDVGRMTAINGAGVFTPLSPQYDIHTGNVQAAPTSAQFTFYPLLMCEYSAGTRSITLRVTANDVNAEMSLCWAGWWEPE